VFTKRPGAKSANLRNYASDNTRVLFLSTMDSSPWGGSEELWSRTALEFAAQGIPVSANVHRWVPPHPRMLELIERGIEVRFRPIPYPLWKRAWLAFAAPQKTPLLAEVQRHIDILKPQLAVISEGTGPFSPVELLDLCIRSQLSFVWIQHVNMGWSWVTDEMAERYRTILAAAQRCYFVSKVNQRLTEKQIGCDLRNAEVVWNPVNVDFNAAPAWPRSVPKGELRFACVARLEPSHKGQDILLEALAGPLWAARPWRLSLYGEGRMRDTLERLVRRLGLSDRVNFAGHVSSVEQIWASNHVLVMPSRFEGLPIAMIEAMLCGRPVIATNVAGHSEVIEDGVTGFLADAPTVSSMANALERFWARRDDARDIGAAAARKIRELVPADPARIFAEKIKSLAADAARVSVRGPS
jgi:glycosyltransferase involved in cell wall biosynthesis